MQLAYSSQAELSVHVLRTPEEIEGVRTEWQSWPGHRDSDIDYYFTIVRSCPASVSPYVLVVRRRGRADAILVGRIDRGGIDYKLGYLHFRPKAKILYFVYGALRGNASSDNCDLFIREIMEILRRQEADAAYLNLLRTDSDLYKQAIKIPNLFLRDHIRTVQPHFVAVLPSSIEQLYRGLSPKVRNTQKRKARKLQAQFPAGVRVRCFQSIGELEELIHTAEEIARRSYQRGLGVGFLDSAETRERLLMKCSNNWLRGYVLYLGQQPAAFWLCDKNGDVFCSEYLGFDPQFAHHSPGTYLILRVIESLCEGYEGVKVVDFSPGYAQYKQVLGNQMWHEAPVYIFAGSMRGCGLSVARTVTGGIDVGMKKILLTSGLLAKAKRIWRASLTPKPVD